ncbi:MAG: GNAT family N-acetyltransferase, partial [Bacteroidota bacterium]
MLNIDFSQFPELKTERLILRRMTEADAEEVFRMRRDESLMQFIQRPVAKTLDDALELIRMVDRGIQNNQSINWGITLKEENKVIGVAGIVRTTPEHHRAEIGYLLAGEHHKKGIISEALKEILAYGFLKLNLHL